MNIPTIEELDRIAKGAVRNALTVEQAEELVAAAIRDAVVAACKPQLRPISEMPDEVPEGCVRRSFVFKAGPWYECPTGDCEATHYIDIALPSPVYPADFEQAFAESKLDAKDKDAAFKLWQKGGAK